MAEKTSKDETEAGQKPPEEAKETENAQAKSKKKADKKVEDDEFNESTAIHVKMYSPFQTYYDDEADSISAENATGPFDILPRHHNFITLLRPCDVEIRSAKGGDKKISISRGVMHVHRNTVTIFLDV